MISRKKYLEAKKIVDQYEAEQLNKPTVIGNCGDFEIGMKVRTTKGCQYKGAFSGEVVGFGKWSDYDAVKVKKNTDGRIVMCLAKNLLRC
jgi:hypothetical protein